MDSLHDISRSKTTTHFTRQVTSYSLKGFDKCVLLSNFIGLSPLNLDTQRPSKLVVWVLGLLLGKHASWVKFLGFGLQSSML